MEASNAVESQSKKQKEDRTDYLSILARRIVGSVTPQRLLVRLITHGMGWDPIKLDEGRCR